MPRSTFTTKYKDEQTCGILSEDNEAGDDNDCRAHGLICGIIPTTNPTSTAIFKTLISLKTRNGIIISPHPRAKKMHLPGSQTWCSRAAIEAGARPDIIGWIDEPTIELTNQLMKHPEVKLILATGGPGHGSCRVFFGNPRRLASAAGNVPVVIDEDGRPEARHCFDPDVEDLR